MNIDKYTKLREKVIERDFEASNKSLDSWLFKSTFLGNVGSIFFAFFLVYPALFKAIQANLIQGGGATILATIVTIIILVIFEWVKRIVLSNLSLDLIKSKWHMTRDAIWWSVLSLAIVGGSAYLSVIGAKNFSQTSQKKNVVIETTTNVEVDSIISVYNNRKNTLILDSDQLRKDNSELRTKIHDTPLNYVNTRKGYQEIVEANIVAMDNNDNKIRELDKELDEIITSMKGEQTELIDKNIKNDASNIFLFILIASSIEFIIIFGLWFRQYYDFKVLMMNQSHLEKIFVKKQRYMMLLKFIFKEGTLEIGDKIIGITSFKEMVGDKSSVVSSDKLVDEFLSDMEHLGIVNIEGKRRFIAMTYEDAMSRVDKFDDTLRLLENLK